MAEAEFGYISPPPEGPGRANEYMDAETTERVVNGVQVKLQRVVDRVVEERLLAMLGLLERIDRNTDSLELTAESLSLNADSIRLDVDEVEELLADLRGVVATEGTLAGARDAIVAAIRETSSAQTAPGNLLRGEVAAVAPGATGTLLTHRAGIDYRILGLMATGLGDGRFHVEVDAVPLLTVRIYATKRDAQIVLPAPFAVREGALVSVTVVNEAEETTSYEATLATT